MFRIIILIILLSFYGCKKDECVFNEKFVDNKTEDKAKIFIKSSKYSCNKLILKGDFFYLEKDFNLIHNIILADSAYYYSENKNDILFDFSKTKKSGELKLNDSLKLQIKYFLDIPSNEGNFRLFKIDNVSTYYNQILSFVFVTHYRYGIVGYFVTGKEADQWYVINYKGYIPNEKYFYSIFKKAELL
ncbi:hypothetical protein [Empedobacter brevis]|uniref:hypothetical protein n=1 Tax=Empedobacter brevis TaxID=247 RepID=UPI001320532C|nr:hypothetical protein [Empedobacter brevis]QHC85949.1 hypothetical protein AS589_14725 [Empedobacter brevis]